MASDPRNAGGPGAVPEPRTAPGTPIDAGRADQDRADAPDGDSSGLPDSAAADPTPDLATPDLAVEDPAGADELTLAGGEPAMAAGSRRGRFGTAWLAAAVAVGLLLGYAAGLLTPMTLRPGDRSAEAGFARDMSTHHAQAIEMAMLAHSRATDPDVANMSADIALTQQAQIGMMQTWLRNWKLNPTGSQPRMAWMPDGTAALRDDGLMPGMATDAQRAELRTATGRDFDVLFLRLMLDHHLGGIHMADGVLDLSDDAEVRHLAGTMVDGQKKEIAMIRSLLAKLGAG